ncbi:hypothetical protein NKG94_06970 [Micromonospora sp. M12]
MVGDATLLRGADRLGDVEPGYPTSDLDLAALPTTSDLDLAALPTTGGLDVAQGALADRGPGRIVLSSWVARDSGLRAGDPVTLAVAARTVDVRVAAVLPVTVRCTRASSPIRPTWTGSACRPRTPVCWPTRPVPARSRTAGVRALRQAIAGSDGWVSRCSPTNGTATTRWCAPWSGSLSVWSA